MEEMQIDPPKIINSTIGKFKNAIKLITPEPNINNKSTPIIKPIPINKSQSISPEPLFKRMRLN
jgi:hypothetical protein